MILRALAVSAAFLPACALAQTAPAQTSAATPAADPPFTAADIEAAAFDGRDLPSGRSPLTAKVQLLLDRSGTSPGVIDGFKGGMSESAIMAFERRAGLPVDGVLDAQVWDLLLPYAGTPATQDYTVTDADAQGLVASIPTDYAEKAAMTNLGYTSIAEKLGERFHMDEKFIGFLNKGTTLAPGATIKIMAPQPPLKGEVTRIIVDKATRRVAGYDAAGKMVVDYPATVGSSATPSPSGDHTVVTVALNPNYTYNPNINFKQGQNDKVLTIPPGPNGPVGSVWIDLSKPTYGIHGTPTPSQLFRNQSNGCVRLTNWDAEELARMVKPGVTRVEFLAPGVTIADVTGGGTPAPAQSAGTAAATAAGIVPAPTASPLSSAAAPTALPEAAAVPDAAAAPLPPLQTADPAPTATWDAANKSAEDTTEPESHDTVPVNDPLLNALNNALSAQGLIPPASTDRPAVTARRGIVAVIALIAALPSPISAQDAPPVRPETTPAPVQASERPPERPATPTAGQAAPDQAVARPSEAPEDELQSDQEPVGQANALPEDTDPPIRETLRETDHDFSACLLSLSLLGVRYGQPQPVTTADQPDCGIARPVEVTTVAPGIALQGGALMRCDTARALGLWVRDVVLPAAARVPDMGRPTGLQLGTTYDCRGRVGTGKAEPKLSEHAVGNAIDIAGFTIAGRDAVPISPREGTGDLTESFQRAIRGGACLFFTTVLGPGSNAAHDDHLHLDIAARRGGWRLCE